MLVHSLQFCIVRKLNAGVKGTSMNDFMRLIRRSSTYHFCPAPSDNYCDYCHSGMTVDGDLHYDDKIVSCCRQCFDLVMIVLRGICAAFDIRDLSKAATLYHRRRLLIALAGDSKRTTYRVDHADCDNCCWCGELYLGMNVSVWAGCALCSDCVDAVNESMLLLDKDLFQTDIDRLVYLYANGPLCMDIIGHIWNFVRLRTDKDHWLMLAGMPSRIV